MITFGTEYEGAGKYAFKSTNGKFFSVDGTGVVRANAAAKGEKELFHFELVNKKVAIKVSRVHEWLVFGCGVFTFPCRLTMASTSVQMV